MQLGRNFPAPIGSEIFDLGPFWLDFERVIEGAASKLKSQRHERASVAEKSSPLNSKGAFIVRARA